MTDMAEYVTIEHRIIVQSGDKITVYNSINLNYLAYVAISVYFGYFSSIGISGIPGVIECQILRVKNVDAPGGGGGMSLPLINT